MNKLNNTFSVYLVIYDNGYKQILTEEEFKYLKENDYLTAKKIDNCIYENNNIYQLQLDNEGNIVNKKIVVDNNYIYASYGITFQDKEIRDV